jgi:YYY domain-containing protein
MSMVVQALAWYVLIGLGGVGGSLWLLRCGLGTGAAWAAGRMLAWTIAGYAGWLAGWAGLERWWWIGVPALVVLAASSLAPRKRLLNVHAAEPELVFALTFVVLAVLRLPGLDVTATEKPMDLAILATLLRPGGIPPGDPWLSGQALPYYHWGFVPWLLPARTLGLTPDVAFNLLVPTVAAVSAQLAWALARALGCRRRGGLMAAFLVVFAGTPDGWYQLLSGVHLASIDLWRSSRAIAGAITEFPLFTFHLGDLHPHVLSVPLLLLALVLARALGRQPHEARLAWPAVALVYGAAAAANPWCAVPAGVAVLLSAVAAEEGFLWPRGRGLAVWLRVAAVGAAGWLLFAPFWLMYGSPVGGLGWVTSSTRLDELALFLGAMLLPVAAVAYELSGRLGGFDVARRQFTRALLLAGVVAVAVASGRPALAVALALLVVIGIGVVRGRARAVRPAWALAMVALALVAAMEVVYVRDPYVGELYRMNTVFKATHVAFILLAVSAPALLGWLRRRRARLAIGVGAVLLACGVPQLGALVSRVGPAPPSGWGGLGWMAPGEAAAARWLFRLDEPAVLVEAGGEAYSDTARMASASGVPVVLGWENHERVWRGVGVDAELRRRRRLVDALYRAADTAEVRSLADELKASHVVLGSVERRTYPDGDFAVIRSAGAVVFAAPGCEIVRLGE